MKKIILFIFCCLAAISCTQKTQPLNNSVIYFNSFENDQDTVGFNGELEPVSFHNEPAPEGGKKSLWLKNMGCIYNPVYFAFPPRDEDIQISIGFYGKATGRGGKVFACFNDLYTGYGKIETDIIDTIWTYYELTDNLLWRAGDTLIVGFVCAAGRGTWGGIGVDNLVISKN